MTLTNEPTTTTPMSHVSASSGTQRNRYTNNLPSSSKSLPTQLTSSSSESDQAPNKKENDRKEIIPVYIFTTFACILCIIALGVLAALYFKKITKTKIVLNTQAQNTSKYIIFVFIDLRIDMVRYL